MGKFTKCDKVFNILHFLHQLKLCRCLNHCFWLLTWLCINSTLTSNAQFAPKMSGKGGRLRHFWSPGGPGHEWGGGGAEKFLVSGGAGHKGGTFIFQ